MVRWHDRGVPSRASAAAIAVLVAAALALAGCAPAGPDPWSAPAAHETASAPGLDSVIPVVRRVLDEHHVPGAVVAISVDGDNEVYPVGNATIWDRSGYRSITKSFVGTVVLQLAEEGKVGLDDPIGTYLPAIRGGDAITVRELLGMRSGVPNYSALPAFQQDFGADPTRVWTDEELLGYAEAVPADFAPGTSYEYSNTNTLMLGMLVAAVTGEDWAAAVEDRIAMPLRLTTVTYPGNAPLADPRLDPYLIDGTTAEQAPEVPATAFSAAGGLAGDAEDLLSWGQALAAGTLLDPALQQERITSTSDPSVDPNSPVYDAYGLAIGELDGWWGHTGNGIGYQALTMADPSSGDGIAIILNGTDGDGEIPAEAYRAIRTALGI